ncbi:MAG: MBL fold metallo-hydrolase, partial [Dehalococcoidia bacterium]|nr:MBL fold metallo-hydrolase [Dehalococcoidia bacterium]
MTQPLDLLFLGSGNAFASGRYWSSFLLNGRYLFDASPVALPHLKRCDVDVDDINAVFISHFHADHFFGLPLLLLDYVDGTPRTRDLTIVGPPGIEQRLRTLLDVGLPGLASRDWPFEVRYQEARDGVEGEAAGLRYTPRTVVHSEHLECFGYRAEIDDGALAYSGDSTLCDPLVTLGEGADVFVLDCSFWEPARRAHMTPDDIRELRRRLGPKPAFVLTHLDAGAP